MKLIYSHLKKFLPDLDVAPQKLRDDLTMIGHFANYYEELPNNDFVIDLDIKINRGDCLGYYGLARDLAVYYQIPLTLPQTDNLYPESPNPDVAVTSPDVIRLMTAKLSGLKVSNSPQWLQDFLKVHEINSVNSLVDLSNYVMLMYGIPNHTFDNAKINGTLTWENNINKKYAHITTLDGTVFDLGENNLLITNQKEPLSTDFVGSRNSGADTSTTSTLVEMAIYNRVRVRLDAQEMKTRTESGVRLEKDLDPETIPVAFNYLVHLITEVCGGHIDTSLGDYYPEPIKLPEIPFDPKKPSIYAGIDIPEDFALDVLKRLGCTIKESTGLINQALVSPPSIRKDITQEEDLIEEVVRFWGYQKIPTNQPVASKQVPDITPPILYLIEYLKDQLSDLGYDEIRSWPLIQENSLLPNLLPADHQPVYTQNSINSEYPVLRTSIISSLQTQQDQYARYKVPQPQFFEIGKVFSKTKDGYQEHYSLGIYHWNQSELSADIEKLFDSLHTDQGSITTIASKTGYYAEINLDNLVTHLDIDKLKKEVIARPVADNHAYELTGQILTLDANVMYDHEQDPIQLINEYSQKIGDSLWRLIITDIYHDEKLNKYRYTFRASYFNMDDKTAKELHIKSFNL